MRIGQTGDVWGKSAVVYCADVETFEESADDGGGDLRGMTDRIEELADLGRRGCTAKAAGIRVVVDLVMNHTSDQHPWFRSAHRRVDDPYRHYYIWSPTKPRSSRAEVVFPDKETSIWQLDERTGEYSLH